MLTDDLLGHANLQHFRRFSKCFYKIYSFSVKKIDLFTKTSHLDMLDLWRKCYGSADC